MPTDGGLEEELKAKAAADEVAVEEYVKKVDGQIEQASVTLNSIKALPPFGTCFSQFKYFWLMIKYTL